MTVQNDHKTGQSGFSLIEMLFVCVILAFTVGMISTVVTGIQRNYTEQMARTDALNDATASLDMITRLIRTAGNNPGAIVGLQAIDPETPVSGQYKSIRIRSDWRGSTMSSMPDGDIADPFEDIRFLVSNGKLMKKEAADASPVEYLDNVIDMTFVYYDTNNALITDPVTNNGSIARIDVTIIVQPPRSQPVTFTSSAYLRVR